MKILKRYIIKNLTILFLSMFLPLFAIASMIFLIKLATYTAVIQLSLWEMAMLYIFVLPELLFYTLPITFFVAATLTLFKLSNDNEIIVLFSLGIQPSFILKVFAKQAILLSVLLGFNFFVIFPHAKILSSNYISYKKSEAQFNLSASEFGHSFGQWLLYIGKDNPDGSYGDVFLFNKNKNEEVLISAKNAEVINQKGILRLKLTDGEGYSYSKEKFSQIDFTTMYINDTMQIDLDEYATTLEYWQSEHRRKAKKAMFIIDTLISLFPLIGLFMVATIGIINVRHQKGRVYLYLFVAIILYFGATFGLQKVLSFYAIPIIALSWITITYFLYRKTILARF
ncbi:MAG: LptF/LptG family permease [Sulfurimonadaceae bacterium]|nr:LptF/LptG family permease [Sulfurimonadaceae bacterium]